MEMVLPRQAGVDQLRPHAGPPLAVVVQRLPGLRAAAPDGAVPLLERVGQQHGPLPAVLHPGLVREGRRLAQEGGPAGAGRRDLPHHLLAQPRAVDLAGARGASTPPSASPSTAAAGPSRRWSPPCVVGGIVFVSSPLYDTVRAAGRDPAQQRPPRRHRGDGRVGRRRGIPARGLRHHPHHAGQLQLAGRRRDRGVPPVRGSAARDPGLHVAAGAHHRVRAAPCCAWRSSPSSSCAERGGRRRWTSTMLHGAARRRALLLRLRLPRLGDVHRDDRHRADGPRRPEPASEVAA